MTQVEVGGRFIRRGFWLLLFGCLMSFGMVLHYVVGARWDTGPEFLKNVTLWYACPWTLSTAVVIGGALGMIAIGTVYAMLGKMVSGARVEGLEMTALTLCTLSLIAIFLTGYVGYFVVDRFWPAFYYCTGQGWEERVAVHAARLHGPVRGRGFSRIQRHPPHEPRDGVM